ncbi:MAG: bifunctional tetrahydrofolate synthase/dihydrofolate synthase [Moraxellaceae bacterium]|nr:bifunctional tetrahydrofolate synthase/dihydrofolate synthase [Pseudomonadales bacterium]MCP5174814.1 bifunctional tetrahydrofolate synthase/dihydrofolate synthase [Moraxellaceae bacterium]HQV22387.1 bifunctional tetrahydrofolate synthase/dihydrofolate synthase [Agitococcus sp.]
MSLNSLSQWLHHLENQHYKAIDMGLARVQAVAQAADLLSLNCPVITVGGTNGKGSTVATLTAICCAAGYKVGTYTSPHIIDFNERIAIDNQPVTDELLINAFNAVEAARAASNISLSYFEFTTLAAFWIFKQAKLDIAILEVGLGGRLDAVNIIDADVAVITSIGIDHTDWLGDTREAISVEKAGIFRAHRPAIYGETNPPQPLLDYAAQLQTSLYIKQQQFSFQVQADCWSWQGMNHQYSQLPTPRLAYDNVATAIAAVTLAPLTISQQALANGVKNAQLAGRAEHFLHNHKQIILDVAHNPHGASFFMQQLPASSQKTIAVFAMLADKDIAGTISQCVGKIDQWFVANLDVPRGALAKNIVPLLHVNGMYLGGIYCSVAAAMQAACQSAQAGDRILVFGSFYTVAAAKQWLQTQ